MKDFDEFRSWIEIDKRFLKGCKKLLFDKDYLWIKDENYYLVFLSFTILIIIWYRVST